MSGFLITTFFNMNMKFFDKKMPKRNRKRFKKFLFIQGKQTTEIYSCKT